jgi:hypothetical protein
MAFANGTLAVTTITVGVVTLIRTRAAMSGAGAPEEFAVGMFAGASALLLTIVGGILALTSLAGVFVYRHFSSSKRLRVLDLTFLLVSTFPPVVAGVWILMNVVRKM